MGHMAELEEIPPGVWSTGLLCAYLCPPVGLVIGLMNLSRKGGPLLVQVSLTAAVFWVVVGSLGVAMLVSA